MDLATRFCALFRGSPYARGISRPTGRVEKGKAVCAGHTGYAPAEPIHWDEHLGGRVGLGVIACTDTGRSWFGAIDLDDYKMDKPAIVRKVYDLDIGAIPCNSKSGGLHIYCFFDEVRTPEMRAFLAHVAGILGYPNAEVFPKDNESKPNHVGNWINMPYYGDSDRKAIWAKDVRLMIKAQDFLDSAENLKQSAAQLYTNSVKLAVGGPKCIVDVFRNGTVYGPGVRHDIRKRYVAYIMEKDIEDKEEACLWFANLATPGDPHEDVLELIRGWENHGFKFGCLLGESCTRSCGKEKNKEPTGPTDLDGDLKIIKYDFDDPLYEFEYSDKPVFRLTHADSLSIAKVELACWKFWGVVPTMPTAKEWKRIVTKAPKEVVKVSESSSAPGELMTHVEKHCRDGVKANTPKERGSWIEDDRHVFTVEGLMSYLDGKKFRSLERRGVIFCLLQRGALEGIARIGARPLETLSLPLYEGAEYIPPAKPAEEVV